jgi:hypothetical protein
MHFVVHPAVAVFEEALNKAFTEWEKENPNYGLTVTNSVSCGPEGNC